LEKTGSTPMSSIDALDLRILRELYRTHNISAIVDRIGLSQPSISIRLRTLRLHFDDALFVRTGEGMMPTPLMDELWASLESALDLLEGRRGDLKRFSPATSSRTFRMVMTNVAQVAMLPALLNRLNMTAPHVKVDAFDLGTGTARMLESGEADLAVGFTLDLQSGYYEQTLFMESYQCLARADHPRVRDRLTKTLFQEEDHVQVAIPGTGYWMFDKALEDLNMRRNVTVRIPSFLALPQVIMSTDLLAVVPARLGGVLSSMPAIRALELPIPSPRYQVKQFWHERFHRDPASRWLRQLISETFSVPGSVG